MGVEDAMEAAGGFGRYQIIHYILISCSFGFTAAWQLFAIVFIGYVNPHTCKIPQNASQSEYLPEELDEYGYKRFSKCQVYNLTEDGANVTQQCAAGWDYKLDGFEPNGTMVMEWDLVCEKDGYVEVSLTVFNVGVVLGMALFTPFGDYFGRKNVFFTCQFFTNAFGIGMAFSNNFIAFCALQFITGAFGAGLYMQGFVLACEWLPVNLRSTLAPVTPMFGSLGLALLALIGYIFRNWRDLQLAISCIGFVFLIYFWWCPESIRWLVAKGRYKEAEKVLQTAAEVNGTTLPEGILERPDIGAPEISLEESGRFLHYLKMAKPRRYMLVMIYLLFVNNLMYYGLSLMMGALYGDLYINFFLNGIIEIPALFAAIIVMAFFGRRWPLVFFQLFSAVFMALSAAATAWDNLPANIDQLALITGLAIVSKFGVAGAFGVEVIYAQEIIPTSIRSTGLGLQAAAGFVGSILSPYLAVYLLRIKYWIPGVIFAVLATIAAFLTLLEPETMGRRLPESAEEVAQWSLTLSRKERKEMKAEMEAQKEKAKRDSGAKAQGSDNPGFVRPEDIHF